MAPRTEPVFVIGLGRFGFSLARQLERSGTRVVAIDSDIDQVQRAADHLTEVMAGDGTDEQVLVQAGVSDFTRAVVAIGADQQDSILATSILSDLGVREIWARALGARQAKILQRVGAHHVVQPESDMGERVAHLVGGKMREYVELGPDWVLVATRPPKYLVGVRLGDTQLRRQRGVTVVSVRTENTDRYEHADTDTVLSFGDEIMVVGRRRAIEDFVGTIG